MLFIFLTVFANGVRASECNGNLVSTDEAKATIHFDLLALSPHAEIRSLGLATTPDEKIPNLFAQDVLKKTPLLDVRSVEVLRGYARFLARRRRSQAVTYNQMFTWTEPRLALVHDVVTGEPVQAIGIGVRVTPIYGPKKTSRAKMAESLLEAIRLYLLAPDDDWASFRTETMANTHLTNVILARNDILVEDGIVNIDKLRSLDTYEHDLQRLVDYGAVVDRLANTTANRGQVIMDMVSGGYPIEWLDSFEVLDIVEKVKPLTKGSYGITLYWDSRNLIDISQGYVRTYSR